MRKVIIFFLVLAFTSLLKADFIEDELFSENADARDAALAKVKQSDNDTKEKIIKRLIMLAKSQDKQSAGMASETLTALGGDAVPYLIDEMANPDRTVSVRMFNIVKKMDRAAVESLKKCLKSEKKTGKIWAAFGVISIAGPDETAFNILNGSVNDEDISASTLAMNLLVQIKPYSDETVKEFLKALKQKDTRVRISSMVGIEKFGERAFEAVPSLIIYSKDEDVNVRLYAGRALAKAGAGAEEAIDAEMIMINDKDRIVSVTAIYGVGSMGVKAQKAIPALINVLSNDDEYIRNAAAISLGQFKSESSAAVPSLIRHLKISKDDYVIIAACDALKAIGTEDALAAVKEYKKNNKKKK